jgi:hypothetical protein
MKAKDNQITGIKRHPREIKWDRFVKHRGKHIPIQHTPVCYVIRVIHGELIKPTDTIPVDCPEIECQIFNYHGKSWWIKEK